MLTPSWKIVNCKTQQDMNLNTEPFQKHRMLLWLPGQTAMELVLPADEFEWRKKYFPICEWVLQWIHYCFTVWYFGYSYYMILSHTVPDSHLLLPACKSRETGTTATWLMIYPTQRTGKKYWLNSANVLLSCKKLWFSEMIFFQGKWVFKIQLKEVRVTLKKVFVEGRQDVGWNAGK